MPMNHRDSVASLCYCHCFLWFLPLVLRAGIVSNTLQTGARGKKEKEIKLPPHLFFFALLHQLPLMLCMQ
jgi:hypothetical protein